MSKQTWSTGDVSQLFNVTAQTIINWVKAGKIKASRTSCSSPRRIHISDIKEYITKQEIETSYLNQRYLKKLMYKPGIISDIIVGDETTTERTEGYYVASVKLGKLSTTPEILKRNEQGYWTMFGSMVLYKDDEINVVYKLPINSDMKLFINTELKKKLLKVLEGSVTND